MIVSESPRRYVYEGVLVIFVVVNDLGAREAKSALFLSFLQDLLYSVSRALYGVLYQWFRYL